MKSLTQNSLFVNIKFEFVIFKDNFWYEQKNNIL